MAEGVEVLHAINGAYCTKEGTPVKAIRLNEAVILVDPFPDPPGLVIPDATPQPQPLLVRAAVLQKVVLRVTFAQPGQLSDAVEVDEFDHLTAEEMEEKLAAEAAEGSERVLKLVRFAARALLIGPYAPMR